MDLMPFLKAKSKKMCKECKKPMAKCKCDDKEDSKDAKGETKEESC